MGRRAPRVGHHWGGPAGGHRRGRPRTSESVVPPQVEAVGARRAGPAYSTRSPAVRDGACGGRGLGAEAASDRPQGRGIDHTLWREMREKYHANGAFPTIYEKVKPEVDPLRFLEEERSWREVGEEGRERATSAQLSSSS